jgi:hypothetical protein
MAVMRMVASTPIRTTARVVLCAVLLASNSSAAKVTVCVSRVPR